MGSNFVAERWKGEEQELGKEPPPRGGCLVWFCVLLPFVCLITESIVSRVKVQSPACCHRPGNLVLTTGLMCNVRMMQTRPDEGTRPFDNRTPVGLAGEVHRLACGTRHGACLFNHSFHILRVHVGQGLLMRSIAFSLAFCVVWLCVVGAFDPTACQSLAA